MVCKPDRVGAVHDLLRVHLWDKCRISLHTGKTKVWNKSGTYPPDCARLQRAATDVSLEAVVWRGDAHLHPDQQGFKVLGVPLGHPAYVKRFLEDCGPQCVARSDSLTHSLRGSSCFLALQPDQFLLGAPRPDCHYGKVASDSGAPNERNLDATKMVKDCHPSVAELIVSALEGGLKVRSIQAVTQCTQVLERTGFDCPPWAHLAEGRTPGVAEEEEDPCQPHTGWQQQAASSIAVLRDNERAMMRSQCGPLASSAFSFPTSRLSRIDSALFRVLLLRRLRLPVWPSIRRPWPPPRSWRNSRLGRGGWALESAAARVCREGGARVRLNVFVRDMDFTEHNSLNGRRLEVVADEFPLHGGAQLAIDTWCRLSTGTALFGEGLPTRTGKLWRWRGDGRNEPIRSSPGRAVEPDWSFLVQRWAGDGPQRQHNSCRLWRGRRWVHDVVWDERCVRA